jgi:hypothetical protein
VTKAQRSTLSPALTSPSALRPLAFRPVVISALFATPSSLWNDLKMSARHASGFSYTTCRLPRLLRDIAIIDSVVIFHVLLGLALWIGISVRLTQFYRDTGRKQLASQVLSLHLLMYCRQRFPKEDEQLFSTTYARLSSKHSTLLVCLDPACIKHVTF